MTAGFFHDADGRTQGTFGISLVATEGKVHHNQSTINGTYHRTCVVNHLVQGNRQGGFVTRHYIRSTIANENTINTGGIYHFSHGKVIGGEHRDFLTLVFHLLQTMGGNLLKFFLS